MWSAKASARRRRAAGLVTTVPCALALAVTACGNLLEVDLPGQTLSDDLADPGLVTPLVAGAIADFECAYSIYITMSGILSGVFMSSQTQGSMVPYNQRNVRPNDLVYSIGECHDLDGVGLYTPLSRARWGLDETFKRLEQFSDQQVSGRTALMARMAAYAGYAYTLFGEGFCSAAFDLGPEMTPTQVFQRAEERFSTAITLAETANDQSMLRMARVGRARARLNLGKTADALGDAQQVGDGFVINATYSATPSRRWNTVYALNESRGWVSVEPAFRNLTFGGVNDSRVPVVSAAPRVGTDGVTPLWFQRKFRPESATIPIARSAEAKLIVAEVVGGQTAVAIINELHSAVGLPAFASTDSATIHAQVIEERRRELFLESHYMGDLRRLGLPFPTGTHPYVGYQYPGQSCFPLPDVERNGNPNLGG